MHKFIAKHLTANVLVLLRMNQMLYVLSLSYHSDTVTVLLHVFHQARPLQ